MAGFWDLIVPGENSWAPALARGTLVTLEISAGAFLTGLLIGSLAAWTKLRGPRWARLLATGYSTVCRAVPELLLILVLFYAGQSALNQALNALGLADIGISGFAAAVVVLGIVQGAYSSEILRAAVLAIPHGQIEAAQAYGLDGPLLFRRITMPAIVPYAVPGLANLWMTILKDSALISVVGTSELLSTANQAGSSTKYYFGFYVLAASVYYAITLLSTVAIRAIERRVRRWMPSSR